MNRMLYLRDLDVDVLIRCRACGHEGLLPHAEATRRFGPAYPVLSIAPHYRCSRCNARDAESSAAPEPDFPYATPHAANEDDGGFAAALASLQNLVEAAHSRPEPPRRKPEPEPDASPFSPVPEFAPQPEDAPSFDAPSFETPPVAAAWDEAEEAAARAAWDAAPVWEPAETRREEPPRRRRETPAMPDRPFVPSRERRPARNEEDEAFAPSSRTFDSPPADSPPAGQSAMLSLADIRALLGEDDEEDEKPPEAAASAPPAEEDVLALWDRDMAADGDFEEKADTAWMSDALSQAPPPADEDDEDDPLLSNTLQRLLRNAHADDEAEADDMPSPDAAETDEETTGDAVAAALGGIAEEEPELSDDELLAFAIGDRDAETAVADLPPELAALLAEGEDLREEPGDGLSDEDEDEDEVYEYTPDEIIAGVDAVGGEGEPVDPSVWAQIAPLASEATGESAPQEDAAPAQDADEGAEAEETPAEAESWFPPAWEEALDETLRAAAQATEDDIPVEDALKDDVVAEKETETSPAAVGDEEEPILLDEPVGPEPVAETPPRFPLGAVEEDPAHDADLAALRALLAQTGGDNDDDDEEEPDFALPPRPARDPLIDDGEDDRDGEEPAAPPAWRTQGPPPAEEGEEGMEDALATLRALIEQAAAEPEPDLEPAFPPPPAPDATELTDEVDVDFPPLPAFASRPAPSPIDEDDPEAWAALMREVKAKATEDDADADATLPLRGPLRGPSPSPSAPPSAGAAIDMTAAKRGGSLDDTLSRLRGLLDLPPGDPPSSRGRGRRKN